MKRSSVILFAILLFGFFLRVYGVNWDQGFHLHPDERFLTMVSTDISIPSSITTYFDPVESPLNPVNKGHAFFVYGLAPITLNRIIGQLLLNTTYDTIHLQGRILSAVMDVLVMVVLYKLIELFERKMKLHASVKFLSAFLYAISVLPIQLSHFFAVDTFLNAFGWLSIYFSARYLSNGKERSMFDAYGAVFFLGLAFASKISAIYYLPIVCFFLAVPVLSSIWSRKKIIQDIGFVFLCLVIFYATVRIGSPYYFESGNILDPHISKVFIGNLMTLKSFDKPGYFPPANQWIHAPWYLSPLNMAVFGLGLVYTALSLIGAVRTMIYKKGVWILFGMWGLGLLIYQSAQFAKTMRYLIFIYPLYAIYAAVGTSFIWERMARLPSRPRKLAGVIFTLALFVWPAAFMSIYTKNHSRVEASYWIYEHLPNKSRIAWEYWDDPLPLLVENPKQKQYTGEQIGIFDPDSAEKWNGIQKQLLKSDYYIMSSNRGWGSIPTTPDRYPLATDFYKDMFHNKRGYRLVKEFTSYPSLRYLGIPIDFPDQWSEEAFTVYDHPKVMIFQRNK